MTVLKRSTLVPIIQFSFTYCSERKLNMLTFKENKGQGLVEYALILVLVAVVVIVILALLDHASGHQLRTDVESNQFHGASRRLSRDGFPNCLPHAFHVTF